MRRLIVTTQKQQEALIARRIEAALENANRSYEQELLLRQANITMLQSQINPHFLYNTLECIRGQALLHNEEEIAQTAKALSLFFRYSISGKTSIVTIGEELDNIKNYIQIQRFRFSERFSVEIDVEDSSLTNVMIPKLTLQPILENSIIHGFSDIVSDGILTIRVKRVSQNVSIEISDNGKGMRIGQLNRIYRQLNGQKEEAEASGRVGIGLQNVDRRIKLLFGDEYGLSLNSCLGMGTTVEVFIPGNTK